MPFWPWRDENLSHDGPLLLTAAYLDPTPAAGVWERQHAVYDPMHRQVSHEAGVHLRRVCPAPRTMVTLPTMTTLGSTSVPTSGSPAPSRCAYDTSSRNATGRSVVADVLRHAVRPSPSKTMVW
jgi:hypothetical protein